MRELVELAVHASIQAGIEIMKIYITEDFGVEIKGDNSPLTRADLESQRVISAMLNATSIPVLSEELDYIPFPLRKEWTRCWIVDPLDGTKEFIKRNGEFTVNIALVEHGVPVFGVIFAPALNDLYYSVPGEGAFKVPGVLDSTPDNLYELGSQRLPAQPVPLTFTIAGSRSHSSPATEEYVRVMTAKHGDVDFVASGSSLKFCLVAEGKAHAYPRFAPTMEWDTAAGHAILVAAGGNVVVWPDQSPLLYNREELLNPWFLASGKYGS